MTQISSIYIHSKDVHKSEQAELQKAAKAFEAIFVRNMIATMRQASIGDDLMGNGPQNQFRDMMDSQIADDAASSGAFGISEQLVKQWKDRL